MKRDVAKEIAFMMAKWTMPDLKHLSELSNLKSNNEIKYDENNFTYKIEEKMGNNKKNSYGDSGVDGVLGVDGSNYFTPSIEDIRVGYECEEASSGMVYPDGREEITEWKKTVYKEGNSLPLSTKHTRVPYLTKEQIEKEGYGAGYGISSALYQGFTSFRYCPDCVNPDKPSVDIEYSFGHKILRLFTAGNLRFDGECKDINTFRYICKLLGI